MMRTSLLRMHKMILRVWLKELVLFEPTSELGQPAIAHSPEHEGFTTSAKQLHFFLRARSFEGEPWPEIIPERIVCHIDISYQQLE
ncbi:hypothetical protein BDA96_05G175500 [Sorghum bicolor]|uniref:Uncharacterized protein n=2 Tax=Sorghum bicolor TaxID=4558 RepID=A0A921R0E5_SORBI|nr:hypothetical protein BDA96_05G175500 [Sorghum bicolor]OQU83685.1 hypothetical protein SORBI_3005G161750 [Sorghum bicolor]